MGGYAEHGTGGTDACIITNNSFSDDDTLQWGNGEIQLRWRTFNCVLAHNTISAGPDNLLITIPVSATNNRHTRLDDNQYRAPADPASAQWIWDNITCDSFAAWQSRSKQDAHSLFEDP
jgi:hypothetical protein